MVYWVDDFDYKIGEYDRIDQTRLDALLADDNIEIVGDLEFENEIGQADPLTGTPETAQLMYTNVRLRRKIDKSRVKITPIPPENLRISRDAMSIDEAVFVGLQTDMTRSEIRKQWPDVADNVENWDELGHTEEWLGNSRYSEDIAGRRQYRDRRGPRVRE